MLVQVLAAYADHYLAKQLDDVAWENKPVPWLLEISKQGTFLGATSRMKVAMRGKKQASVPQELQVPRSPVNRNSGHYPLLTADDVSYVLGCGTWTPDKAADREKAAKHHEAFVALIGKAAAETGNTELEACERFYANPAEVDKAREALREAKAGMIVALSIGGPLVDLESVRAYWKRHYQDAFDERMEGAVGECIVSGKIGAIAPTHEKIKGASSLGGQASGVALMSFDKEAFRSYGWEQNQNSPVSPDRAMAYVLALNDLLRLDGGAEFKRRRKDYAGIGFVYWTRDPSDFDMERTVYDPDVADVEDLLKLKQVELDPNQFYLAGVSGNGGRLRVRYWVADSLHHVQRNLSDWHRQLRVAYPWDDPGPVRFWQLLNALDREGEPPAHHTLALLRRAIEGKAKPLGYGLLSAVLCRLRHPGQNQASSSGRTDPRGLPSLRIPIGLIRLCINDIQRKNGENEMSEGLDPSCPSSAYLCGRLMAEFDNLQRASSGEVNASVLDRYFSLASTYPAVAFPKIEILGQKHLRKLRRDNAPAAYAIDARLREIHNKLKPNGEGAYPSKLDLKDQGLFMLGYYHQKAWSIAQAIERKRSNESDNNDAVQENE